MNFQSLVDRFDPIPVKKSRASQTVPDMSYTPREIISKFSRGERVPLGFQGLYDSLDDVDQDKYENDKSMFEDDPTRDPEFDFGDYVEEKYALQERISKKKQSQKSKQESPLQREARREELSASDAMSGETTSEKGDPAPPG